MNLSHDVLYGGLYHKNNATEALPFLDEILSYPTLIFLDKNNTIVDIYTGFNGPATPQYEDFIERFNNIVTKL